MRSGRRGPPSTERHTAPSIQGTQVASMLYIWYEFMPSMVL